MGFGGLVSGTCCLPGRTASPWGSSGTAGGLARLGVCVISATSGCVAQAAVPSSGGGRTVLHRTPDPEALWIPDPRCPSLCLPPSRGCPRVIVLSAASDITPSPESRPKETFPNEVWPPQATCACHIPSDWLLPQPRPQVRNRVTLTLVSPTSWGWPGAGAHRCTCARAQKL